MYFVVCNHIWKNRHWKNIHPHHKQFPVVGINPTTPNVEGTSTAATPFIEYISSRVFSQLSPLKVGFYKSQE